MSRGSEPIQHFVPPSIPLGEEDISKEDRARHSSFYQCLPTNLKEEQKLNSILTVSDNTVDMSKIVTKTATLNNVNVSSGKFVPLQNKVSLCSTEVPLINSVYKHQDDDDDHGIVKIDDGNTPGSLVARLQQQLLLRQLSSTCQSYTTHTKLLLYQ